MLLLQKKKHYDSDLAAEHVQHAPDCVELAAKPDKKVNSESLKCVQLGVAPSLAFDLI